MKCLMLAALISIATFARSEDGADKNAPPLVRLATGDQRAIAILVQQGEAALPGLVELLNTGKSADPSYVVIALAEIAERIGPRAKPAVPALCDAMTKTDRAVAATAARALGSIGPDAVPDVIKTLEALSNQRQVEYPIRALRHIGPGAKDAAPVLLKTLQAHRDPKIHIACIEAIGALGPTGKDTADQLLSILATNKKSPYATHIIRALGGLEADAKTAIPYLIGLIDSSSEEHLRIHALEALAKIGSDSAELNDRVATLLEIPTMPKLTLLGALGRGGPLSKSALKRVEETLRDRDPVIRLHGAIVYGNRMPDHPAVVSILIETMNDRDAKRRKLAAETLGIIRPRDAAVIAALHARREDPDALVRRAAADALTRFQANGSR